MSRFAQIFEDPDYDTQFNEDYTDQETDSKPWQNSNESENSTKELENS